MARRFPRRSAGQMTSHVPKRADTPTLRLVATPPEEAPGEYTGTHTGIPEDALYGPQHPGGYWVGDPGPVSYWPDSSGDMAVRYPSLADLLLEHPAAVYLIGAEEDLPDSFWERWNERYGGGAS